MFYACMAPFFLFPMIGKCKLYNTYQTNLLSLFDKVVLYIRAW